MLPLRLDVPASVVSTVMDRKIWPKLIQVLPFELQGGSPRMFRFIFQPFPQGSQHQHYQHQHRHDHYLQFQTAIQKGPNPDLHRIVATQNI